MILRKHTTVEYEIIDQPAKIHAWVFEETNHQTGSTYYTVKDHMGRLEKPKTEVKVLKYFHANRPKEGE